MNTDSSASKTNPILIPPSPFSNDCSYTATVDPIDTKRVRICLKGRTENGLKELEALHGRATLNVSTVGGGYYSSADKHESDDQNSYYWTFPAAGDNSHFKISDGADNPFRINFVKTSDSRYYEIMCEFFLVFGNKYDYNPALTYITIDYPIKDPGGIFRDTFKLETEH
ncbi:MULTISPECIES: hypothetical protein [Pseudomonas]|uniref:Uncharacterized protein n=1 Tax=Pseudomonas frederiksbergensis TaxID=104087 RepID=A0A2S8H7N9_9PSED|nr:MULTISPECIES: hypothetical protein [Pseudomonas]PQO98454.1 hypothetical protein C5612_27955 [Pseudomonas frederiksbergensis]WLG49977.1 hypothetical protein PSH64_25225 [Pseudomonas sp. FP1742]